ncbi:hypothetical protein [Anabaena sp. 4-3]|uniref:hypothetical protein n=1 Tax=Anabaena sp. 4-3 TaxID=1811979 RepID=UPI00082D5775|nr:hypothetical protein [Anabaena sp. 4-3]
MKELAESKPAAFNSALHFSNNTTTEFEKASTKKSTQFYKLTLEDIRRDWELGWTNFSIFGGATW